MDSKFYVSYEAARLLKVKGYNELVKIYYSPIGQLNEVIGQYEERWLESDLIRSNNIYGLVNNEYLHGFGDYYAAPTKAEVIDWLESKGKIIEVFQDYRGLWFYVIKISEIESYLSESDDNYFPTRLEAEEAAIIKALEIL